MNNRLSLLLILSTSFAFSTNNIEVPTNGSDLKITIYNSNLAFINDKRSVFVPSGKSNIVYQGVPKNLISESVIPTFSNTHTELFSQNYMYDLINIKSLLNNSIDKEIEFYKNDREEANPQLFKGILLAANPILVKNSEDGKIITLQSHTQVIFNKIPENMITKPSLVWETETKKEGELNIDLKYLSTGISWKSDYVLDLKKETLNLKGWITIKNNSGVSYDNAEITCLAGSVNRVQSRQQEVVMYKTKAIGRGMVSDAMMSDKEVKEKSFSGYHIYKIPFNQDIKNNQNKQITFIDKKDIKFEKYGINVNNYFSNYGKMKMVFNNVLEFKNDKENNLGIPLPSGKIRMYSQDNDFNSHFIGEDNIGNIPKKEKVKLNIGTLFDVVGEKRISKYRATKYMKDIETTYTVKNRGKDKIEIRIKEHIPTYGRDIKVDTTCNKSCSVKKESAFIRTFKIKLDEGEVYEFKSHFKINF